MARAATSTGSVSASRRLRISFAAFFAGHRGLESPIMEEHPTARSQIHPLARVRRSPVHGLGLFAAGPIGAGEKIGTYAGRRYGSDDDAEWEHALTYLFRLSDGTLIDGREGGNATRHINHSCEPNCSAYEVEDAAGCTAIIIEAARAISSGEELYLDYALDVDEDDDSNYSCTCGAARCRGTMVAI